MSSLNLSLLARFDVRFSMRLLLVVKTQLVTNQPGFMAVHFSKWCRPVRLTCGQSLRSEAASHISVGTETGFFCEIYFSSDFLQQQHSFQCI